MHQTSVDDYHFCERGFVVRAWQDGSYTEYSFNNLTDAADLAEEITSALKSEFQALKALGIAQMESPLVQEEAIAKTMQNEIGIDPETVSAEEILSHLRKLCDAGAAHEGILEFQSTVSFARVNKLFLSSKKDLMQSYAFSECNHAGDIRRGDDIVHARGDRIGVELVVQNGDDFLNNRIHLI